MIGFKAHDFPHWVWRIGLDDRAVAAIEARALAIPVAVRTPHLDVEGGRIVRPHGHNLIVRAETVPRER